MNVSKRIEALLKAVAKRMNNRLSKVSTRTKKYWLIVTGCSMAMLCLLTTIAPFTNVKTVTPIPVEKIITTVIPPVEDPLLSPEDLDMLRDFKHVMDSLKIHDLETYQGILQGREGLLDSVELLLRWHQ